MAENPPSAHGERRIEKYDSGNPTLTAVMDRVEVFVANNAEMPARPSRPLPPEAHVATKFSAMNAEELCLILNDMLQSPVKADQATPDLNTELRRREARVLPERQFLAVLQIKLKKAEERMAELERALESGTHARIHRHTPKKLRQMLAVKRMLEKNAVSLRENVVRAVWQRIRLALLNNQGLDLEDECHVQFTVQDGKIHHHYIAGSAPFKLERFADKLKTVTEKQTQKVHEMQAAISLLRSFLLQVRAGLYTPLAK